MKGSAGKQLAAVLQKAAKKGTKAYDATAEVVRVEGDTLWVHIPGGVDETPIRKTINAIPGDSVQVRVSGGRAWITGNRTAPPTDDRIANQAKGIAQKADSVAAMAIEDANQAHQAAEQAWNYADSAKEAADLAWTHAEEAYDSAFAASVAADLANTEAQKAVVDAGVAHTASEEAKADAATANQAALEAQGAADDAKEDAATAHDEALSAAEAAGQARARADEAYEYAGIAKTQADQATESARTANIAASGAISSLSIVEDVLGALNWISQHATYKATSDTSVVPGKYYFTKSGSEYSPIVPAGNADPHALGYYEIDSIDEGVSNYVATHLALGNDGLYIQTSDDENTSRMLVSPELGVVFYGPSGEIVAKYGDNTIIGNEADFHITISNQEVGFYDGGTRVAYINNQRLYITQSIVLDSMMIGENKWIWKYDDRDDSIILKWVG